jgi:hypothetical protein
VEVLIIAGSGTAVLAALLLTVVPCRRADATACGFSWRRRIDINQQVWEQVTESTAPPPGNARNVRRSQKALFVSKSAAARSRGGCSVTGRLVTVYTYQVPRWRQARTVTAAGEGQVDVHWPSCGLAGDERAGRRTESYRAVFQAVGGEQYTARMREARWLSLKAGTAYPLRLNAPGFVLKVGTPAGPTARGLRAGRPGRKA